jgi:Ca2+-transporting ATPase
MVDKDGSGKVDFVGNRTECALLMMLHGWGQDYKELRNLHHEATVGASCCACCGQFASL